MILRSPVQSLLLATASLVLLLSTAANASPAGLPPPLDLRTNATSPADGCWTKVQSAPVCRERAATVYDSHRQQMIVFGGQVGQTGPPSNDVWTFGLGPDSVWTLLQPSGSPPAARLIPTAIFDPVRDRVVVFGGSDGAGACFADVWELTLGSNPVWTQLDVPGPLPPVRGGHSAIYDPIMDRMVIYGGFNGTILGDVWALDLAGPAAWTDITPSGPSPAMRYHHTAIYDPLRKCMVIFGGASPGYLNDTWVLSLGASPAWIELTPSGSLPPIRWSHTAIYDSIRDRMVVYGGSTGPPAWLADTWALSLGSEKAWVPLSPSGTMPPARAEHGAIYVPGQDRMVAFGGYGENLPLDDTWSLSWMLPAPQIVSIRDVGNDQGRQLRITWERSQYDAPGDSIDVIGYAIYRRQDQNLRPQRHGSGGPVARRLAGWDYLTTVPARGDLLYQTVVPSLCDSTANQGICWSTFMVSAVTPDLFSYYDSVPDRGYSVDNLAPAPPENLRWNSPAVLVWDEAPEPDFDYFTVYGSSSQQFNGAAVLLAYTAGTQMDVSAHIFPYYFVTAADYAGNEGSAATLLTPSGVDTDLNGRLTYSLGPTLPNPVRGEAILKYSLPSPGQVELGIYDAEGRLVRQIVEGVRPAGRHEAVWNGCGQDGGRAPSGVYFLRLHAGMFRATDRLIVLQ
jgi:hypothetical protein